MAKRKAPTNRWGEFGRFLRAHRIKLGISLTRLARSIEFDQGVLSKIERGIRRAPQIVPYVQRIAVSLGFEPSSDEYRELMDLAYKERFSGRPEPTGRSLIVTLGPAHDRVASRGLGGLPPEQTSPDSPAGRYYASQGFAVGGALQEERSREAILPQPPRSPEAPLIPVFGIDASLLAQAVHQFSSMGIKILRFEQRPTEAAVEVVTEMPDGQRYVLTIMREESDKTET